MLISRTDIESFKDVSIHTTDSKLNQFINEAQVFDLRPLLGDEFYFHVVNNPGTYTGLIDRSDFDVNGSTFEHYGLKSVLVEFFWARYTRQGGFNDTPTGNTIKLTDFSTETPKEDKRNEYKLSRQNANDYFELVKKYLDNSGIEYWKGTFCSEVKKGFRISNIK